IPFDQVKVGALIHVKYEVDRDPIVEGVFSTYSGISNSSLAEEEEQNIISELPLHVLMDGFEDFYTLTEGKNGERFETIVKPTEKARLLVGKRLKVGTYAVTTAKSWQQINTALSRKYEDEIQKPLPAEFAEIVQAAKISPDPKTQIETVASRLKKIITY